MDISIILIIGGIILFFIGRASRKQREGLQQKDSHIRTTEEWQKFLKEEQKRLDEVFK